jgi:diguanylate cyclase (GGDEF)-like protein
LEDEIQHKAFHDPLTGLANRGLFRDRLTHAHHRRHPRDPLAVIFLDLDDFKAVNDSLGHATGDELLIAVARLLETLVRPSDTIARFGGDEFAILVDDTDNETAAIAVAKRIGGALRQTLSLESGEVTVRASIGIAIEDELSSPDDLLRDADIAMYAVKDQDKDGYEVCDDDMRTNALRRLEVKQELKRAILDEEFVLHFQPIVKLDTQDLVAVEALVRWNHPQWGMVPPNDFIPVAEESALIVPLGEWILREATSQAKGLQETLGKRFAVSVNLSARQLEEQDIVRVVRDALDLSGLPASDLILEITETVLVGNKEETSRTLKELRDMGVQIAIDDFGTGYSSLSYLHRFPFDILKIDRAFIGGVDEGPEEAALAQAVIQLASVLNVYTVAEGIETDGQLERLKSFGCSTGQGFLFSRPLPMTELRAWFADGAERDPALASI